MGFFLITTMRVVPAAVRASAPDDALLGLPLPAELARRRSDLAGSISSSLSGGFVSAGHALHRHHHNHHISLPTPHLRPPHIRSASTAADIAAPAPCASSSFGSDPSNPVVVALGEEEKEALQALRARIPLAERHIQRLVDAAADWMLEHPNAPAPPGDLWRQLLFKLHAHLPLDDGTHYSLRLSLRTPLEPPLCPTEWGPRNRSASASNQVSRSTSTTSSSSSSHAPWAITAHVSIAPAMGDSLPAVRLDTEPARRFPTHPLHSDATGAFSVTHKTSYRQRYEEAQRRVHAKLTPKWDPVSVLHNTSPLPVGDVLGLQRSVTIGEPPPGSTAGLAKRLVLHDSSAPREQLSAFDPPGAALEHTHSLGALDTSPRQAPVFDVLLWSRDAVGQTRLLESGIANLLLEDLHQPIDQPERFITSPIKPRDGPLPGLVRAELLGQGLVSEEDVRVVDLVSQPDHWRIYLCNSVRGVFEVKLVE